MEDQCDGLNLIELENEELHVESRPLDEVLFQGNHCLLVKLCSRQPFKREDFKSTLRKIWRPMNPVCFHELGSGLLLAEFENLLEKGRVMRDSPWNFDRSLVLLQVLDGRIQVKNLKLTEASFWIRVHDLPLKTRNEYIDRIIEKSTGRFEEMVLDSKKLNGASSCISE